MKNLRRQTVLLLCLALSSAAMAQNNPQGSMPDLTGRGDNRSLVQRNGKNSQAPQFAGGVRPESTSTTPASNNRTIGIVIALCAVGGAAALLLASRARRT